MKSFTAALAITSSLLVSPGWADETLFLLERKIPLGEVRGRIDHLAVDLARSSKMTRWRSSTSIPTRSCRSFRV
jgi:hypothetical protein